MEKCLKKVVCMIFVMSMSFSLMFNSSYCYAADPELPSVEVDGIIYSKTEENGEPVAFVSGCNEDGLSDEADVYIHGKVEIDGDFCKVKSIGKDALARCKKIRLVFVPCGVTSIEDGAFYMSFIQNVILEGVESIGEEAFFDCENLVSVDMGNNVKSIGKFAFNNCGDLRRIEIPRGVDRIETCAFLGCRSVERLTIPGSVKSIEDGTFEGLSNLKEVIIEEGVESLDLHAFGGCVALETLKLPKSVHTIDFSAFSYCMNLQRVLLPAEIRGKIYAMSVKGKRIFLEMHSEDSDNITALFGKKIELVDKVEQDGIVYGICSGNPKLAFVIGWNDFIKEVKIEEKVEFENNEYTVVGIADAAFYSCESLYSIEIPSSVKLIGDSAFCGCTDFNYVEFGGGIERIGNGAFFRCPIKTLDLIKGVESVGEYAFYECKCLETVSLSKNVKAIGPYAFYDSSMKELNMESPTELREISQWSFAFCNRIESLIIPEGVEEITIPGSVELIESEAFLQNKNLRLVRFEEGVKFVGEAVFNACESLQQLIFPSSLKELGVNAMISNCEFLALPRRKNFVKKASELFPDFDISKITWLSVDDLDQGIVSVHFDEDSSDLCSIDLGGRVCSFEFLPLSVEVFYGSTDDNFAPT